MKIYLAYWCDKTPYEKSEGIISAHLTEEGAKKACEEYLADNEDVYDDSYWWEIELND